MRPARPTSDPDSSQAAYLLGLRWLAMRELSEHQLRQRWKRRGFTAQAIDPAIERLTRERAFDERRAALAVARTDAAVHHRGPVRIMHRLRALGVDRDLASRVIQEVFDDLDERAIMQKALDKRLRGRMELLRDRARFRRIHAYLVRQGFAPSAVMTLLRTHSRSAS